MTDLKQIPQRRWPRVVLDVLAIVLTLGAAALCVAPIFSEWHGLGGHDWDPMETSRYVSIKTIKHYHQFPFWNPYSCGGHTWWGGLESGVNLVSPFFPVYLLCDLPVAMRIEVAGAAALGVIGTWMLVGRFTKSAGIRMIIAVAFALNSRWSMQASVGHTWHLYYAWIPWALFFLDRAITTRKHTVRELALFGAMLAMMVYNGAIYPLPQTILLAGLYAIGCAIGMRSWRPIGLTICGGLFAFAFSAPRLLPIFDMLRRFPRLVDSTETMDLSGFVGVFTAKTGDPHPNVGPWGWHEWGIYIGWLPFVAMLLAPFVAKRARDRAMALAGVVSIILAFGRFNKYAPWGELHDHVPVFESQHVPSRWLYPAVLVLLVGAAAAIERVLARQPRRMLLEVAILFLGVYVALDITLESQRPFVGALARKQPPIAESFGPFHQEHSAPPTMRYAESDWAPPSYPASLANIGVTDCSTFPGLHNWIRNKDGSVPGLGAKGRGDPGYAGEASFATGAGYASIVTWTPNVVSVHYSGAQPGDVLVLNENWDAGWSADGRTAIDWNSANGTRVQASSGEVVFRYRSPFFMLGLAIFLLTISGLVVIRRMVASAR